MLYVARRGDAVEQYPGGADERAGAIDAGASRDASALRDDVARSAGELEETWTAMMPAAWDGHGLSRGRQRAVPHLAVWPAGARWRSTTRISGGGYTEGDWPIDYVDRELPLVLATVPGRIADADAPRRLLAWLIARGGMPGELALALRESRPTYRLDGISRRA
jgi:maleylpyruvate isomerase